MIASRTRALPTFSVLFCSPQCVGQISQHSYKMSTATSITLQMAQKENKQTNKQHERISHIRLFYQKAKLPLEPLSKLPLISH